MFGDDACSVKPTHEPFEPEELIVTIVASVLLKRPVLWSTNAHVETEMTVLILEVDISWCRRVVCQPLLVWAAVTAELIDIYTGIQTTTSNIQTLRRC